MAKTKTKTKRSPKQATERQIVEAAARRHGVPGWLLWGIYGAENSFSPTTGVTFGLIGSSYEGRTPESGNLAQSADIAAETMARLKRERGSWAAAMLAYSGGDYDISHPRQLARSHPQQGQKLNVDIELGPLDIPFPGPDINPLMPSLPYLDDIGGALSGSGIPGIEQLGEIGQGLAAIAQAIKGIAAFTIGLGKLILSPEGWLRLGKLIGGMYLLYKGLNVIIQQSTGVDVGRTAKGAVKKGGELAALAATVK